MTRQERPLHGGVRPATADPLLEARDGAEGFQAPGNPPPVASLGPRRWNKASRAPGSLRLQRGQDGDAQKLSRTAFPAPTATLREARQPRRSGRSAAPATRLSGSRRGACTPPLATGSRPTRAQAYLVLDLGREPIGRALVEVGHDDSGAGRG